MPWNLSACRTLRSLARTKHTELVVATRGEVTLGNQRVAVRSGEDDAIRI